MTIDEAIAVAERLEKEDCIGTTSLALRALLRGYNDLLGTLSSCEEHLRGQGLIE